MFCPKCGQSEGIESSRFCWGCGFRLDGLVQLLARNGAPDRLTTIPPQIFSGPSPRKKGLMLGARYFLAGIASIPITAVLFTFLGGDMKDHGLLWLFPIALFLLGLARMFFARLFEDDFPSPTSVTMADSRREVFTQQPIYRQPAQAQRQASAAQVKAPTTGRLVQPHSVTEETTHLLDEMKRDVATEPR
jgi:hypothetical protein